MPRGSQLLDESERIDTQSMSAFGAFVKAAGRTGALVVQPRMGFSDPAQMRAGLVAIRAAARHTVGTITIDSFTRTGNLQSARDALAQGINLNGYPICAHPAATTKMVLDGSEHDDFPVQVRHGSPAPAAIFASMSAAGLHATEGGPVSYCLPYSRTPLSTAVANWSEACQQLAALSPPSEEPHIECFGGCMLGQLCPPELLVALSILEGMFFEQNGIRSISLSYSQQTNADQDVAALRALRTLASEFLSSVDWHVVFYAYMGVYPRTRTGAHALLERAVEIGRVGGAHRLIVKTAAEAHRIPTIDENVEALQVAAAAARRTPRWQAAGLGQFRVYESALVLIGAVLELGDDVGQALLRSFRLGLLDIPYCLHPDNAGRSRSYLDRDGVLCWANTGSMPLATAATRDCVRQMTSNDLLEALDYMQNEFDSLA